MLFQNCYRNFKNIHTWGYNCDDTREPISFVLPKSKVFVNIEIDYYDEKKETWNSPIVYFIKNGIVASVNLMVGGNDFLSSSWSSDERFIVFTESDRGADHSTIIDVDNRKVIKQYGGYDHNVMPNDNEYGSRAILFHERKALFLPTLSYESIITDLKIFDCNTNDESIIACVTTCKYNNLIVDDYCVIGNILVFVTSKNALWCRGHDRYASKQIRFINIDKLVNENIIEEYFIDNSRLQPIISSMSVGKIFADDNKLVCFWDNKFEYFELIFHDKITLPIRQLIPLIGVWDIGYSLSYHTISSRKNEDGTFDTVRTEIGEMLYDYKYKFKKKLGDTLAVKIVSEMENLFCGFGLGSVRVYQSEIDVIIPIPPSDTNRPFQPVLELAKKISELSSIPVDLTYLSKSKRTPPVKNIDDVTTRSKLLKNAFCVIDTRYKGKRVLLFDDLYRSGETMNSVARTLKDQGQVENISVLTITRTRSKK